MSRLFSFHFFDLTQNFYLLMQFKFFNKTYFLIFRFFEMIAKKPISDPNFYSTFVQSMKIVKPPVIRITSMSSMKS